MSDWLPYFVCGEAGFVLALVFMVAALFDDYRKGYRWRR